MAHKECKYIEKCGNYDAEDPSCIEGNAPHKFLRKPYCYTPKLKPLENIPQTGLVLKIN